MRLILLGLMALSAFAQQGTQVIISQGPKVTAYQKLFFYTGSNLTYVCTANSNNVSSSVTITAATAASPGVFTSVGHGFDTSTRPRVSIASAPSGWSGVVGPWILVPIDADTFSLRSPSTGTALNTTGFTPAWSGSYTATTQAPRTTMNIWQVEWFQYDGSNNLTSSLTAFSPNSTQTKCSDRASTYLEWR